ncbi:MAG TPA: isoprenylcysteine carboxylmethyltransferase family protein [Planctomycetota bacterium]|nr:isoprenylcysteine carboxylmethyltransferase family protein [Planctomycetota bacterium]
MLAVKAILWTLVAPGTVDVVVPAILIATKAGPMELGTARWLGLPLFVIGAPVLVWCVVNFAREGKGTLAPVDPPKFVVRGGPYRFVRNPMYVANVLIVSGEALFFESWAVGAWGVLMAAAFHGFVVRFEEPTLKRLFGDAYEEYRRSVPRWIPRVRRPRS